MELKEDLLDHFCCFIESEVRTGSSFETAYAKALNEICPNGFNEIQAETIFLLNSNKVVAMKKLMYSIGLLSSISISIGWLFKLLNWPGGDVLVTYGFPAFVLVFLPLLAFDRCKHALSRALSEKLKLLLGFGSAIITGLAVVFKLMHLQGADMLLIGGTLLFSFLPFLFFRMYKKATA